VDAAAVATHDEGPRDYISGAWCVAALVLSSLTGNEKTASSTDKAPPATKAASWPEPSEPPATKPPPPPLGQALVEKQPLLLIPAKLDGFALESASPLPTKVAVGVAATYKAANKHLVARLSVNRSDVKPEVDKDTKPFKVATHDGYIVDNIDEKQVIVEWLAGGWYVNLSVDYEQPTDKPAARKAIEKIAPQVSAQVDDYLTGTPPSEDERKQQLVAVTEATSANNVKAFVAKLGTAGITNDLVASAKLGLIHDELVVTVGETWHQAVRQDRLMAAQNLWKLWASINSPTDPDHSRIKLVDTNGNEVGGSGVMGSSISVVD
jgi:hypothetical protein